MPMKDAGRVYDYVEISMAIDFYVIMDYDISGSDLSWANSTSISLNWVCLHINSMR